jgi:DNA-binding MarR family transcriptional regulator
MIDQRDFADCQDCRCLAARKEAQRLSRLYDERLRPHGLTINQFSMLTALIVAGPLPMAKLATLLGIERTTLTRNVALSQKAGLVAIGAGRDGRERVVSLTATGLRRAEDALPAWRAAQTRVTRGD